MIRPSASVLVALCLLLASAGLAQQPNQATASLNVNGVETGSGPMAAIADPCTGLNVVIASGSNPSQPFALFQGPVAPGFWASDPTIGILDLAFTAPTFQILADGISGLAGDPVLNAFCHTDLGGTWSLSASVGFGVPGGSLGGIQAAVADPAAPQGFLLTAATDITLMAGAVGGALSLTEDAVIQQPFTQGFSFTYYGTSYSDILISDNGVVGFGNLTGMQAMNTPGGTPAQIITNSSYFLGTGAATPPVIGFFNALTTNVAGNTGSVLWSESPTQFSVTWCSVGITAGGGNQSHTVILYGDASATPGRIEITVTEAEGATLGNGRVWGISPGGNGTASNSPTLTGVNVSAVSRNIQAGGANSGYVPANPMDAIYESFNFAWGFDPINPLFDLLNDTMRFDPAQAPGTGPYTLRALTEAPLTLNSVNPISAPLAGGGMITLKGRGFRNDATLSASLGTMAISPVAYVDSETATGAIPPSPTPQTVNVSLTQGSLPATVTLMNGFTYSMGPITGTLPLTDEELATYQFNPNLFNSFTIYGQQFTDIHVHANGHAFFAPTAPVPTANDFVSDPPTWNGFADITLAPLFNDLCASNAPGCSSTGPQSSITTAETANSFTITWSDWVQWPNLNPTITFSMTLDTAANSLLFDYSASPVAPNINWSQPGGAAGIIVGMKPSLAQQIGTTPIDFATSQGTPLGVNANMFHWMPSGLYTGGIAPSGTGGWIFGSSTSGPPTMILFTSANPGTNSDWVLTLL
jgi:hypothetical protein